MGEVNGTKSLDLNQAQLIALLQRVEKGITVAADVQKDTVKTWVLAEINNDPNKTKLLETITQIKKLVQYHIG